ncbi:hypothetical protein GUITHDRAFT_134029 [Guillardia theta CCMP2712]|uniref:Uncharacterized protein n=1 Tax=Guillardia theta (strain CCMP2712) TaxID=905079 RepID=L1JVL5_GUITC|nr:hypothetical protein GUITHDRAFT_134029 [Guillardia theta CCMP2712]EKX52344.1 hypothetical protein GUITHDRAFT_134029 [Guillardia theta CCMP2712]|eukprot:XP_005839324.1 hypothetical protein GUITHDRAFT_134029 [Guillardia theta CCMP2712]
MEAYRSCVALNPGREESWIQLAGLYLSLGDIPSALRSYLSALESNPSCSAAHAGIGRILEQGGKTEAAIVSYEKAMRAGGGDKATLMSLYTLYFRSRRFEAARDVAQRLCNENTDDEDVSTKLGHALMELGRTAEAQRSFLFSSISNLTECNMKSRRAVDLNQGYGPAYNGLGVR